MATGTRKPGATGGRGDKAVCEIYGLYAQRIDDRDVLTEVVLPDGRSLRFKYNSFGEVAEIVLPTGAKIDYDYGFTSSLPSGNSPTWETGTDGAGNGIPTNVKWVDRTVQAKRTYPDGVNLEGRGPSATVRRLLARHLSLHDRYRHFQRGRAVVEAAPYLSARRPVHGSLQQP